MIVLYEDRDPVSVSGMVDGDALWLDPNALRTATGWELRAEGACRGDACVPLLRGWDGARVNLAALAAALGQPVVRADEHGVWSIGLMPTAQRSTTSSLEAPEFALPDLEGRVHRSAEWRGRKVLLVSWASW